MSVPSQIPLRNFPPALRTRIQVALALYWETLVDSHTGQAQQFIGEFAHRVSPTQALELYCAVVPVPGEMQEAVWTRTLATLDLDSLSAQTPIPTLSGMRWLRLDLILKLLQYRRNYNEKTHELARMVGARSSEVVTATHVQNAADFAELVRGVMPVERATAEYLRAFALPLGAAQTVLQRVKAAVAGEHLAAQYAQDPALDPELVETDEGYQHSEDMHRPSTGHAPA
jgi:hypothetical protein